MKQCEQEYSPLFLEEGKEDAQTGIANGILKNHRCSILGHGNR